MHSCRLLDESPHWLAARNRTKEALAVLQKMAKWNGANTNELSFDPKSYMEKEVEVVAKKESLIKVFTHRRLFSRFLIFSYGW